MKRTTLKRSSPLKPMSDRRRAYLASVGVIPSSTLARTPIPKMVAPKPIRRSDTGPSRRVVELLSARSSGFCEMPGCIRAATDKHHRLNRKAGGRKGAMRDRINGVAWLLHACRPHHDVVTSPVGATREQVIRMGWLLLEGQDALSVPVLTRHHPMPVWLDDDGSWHAYEEGAA